MPRCKKLSPGEYTMPAQQQEKTADTGQFQYTCRRDATASMQTVKTALLDV
jgi:hypothetical protein